MRPILAGFTTALVLALSGAAHAQTTVAPTAPTAPGVTGTVAPSPGNTGSNPNVTIAPGPTGASTIQTDSATGGNAGQPERAVPQGGGNAGGGK
ncbi:hypothetical protein OPKNFCMD_0984 [Methylobacterium crusticola]|uniref:Proteophosphoglycan ppg4 n=1 Tax=Methylobacterium crusticola TaxID=1697972 RepID=A0ABQ4QSI2_9HYPH|nr:hypothetical protein [Methylobacterium crusticola]GJD48267.1 hypothetical protein OPKNFCMD_0984 [Methylobacterium crusticola]